LRTSSNRVSTAGDLNCGLLLPLCEALRTCRLDPPISDHNQGGFSQKGWRGAFSNIWWSRLVTGSLL